MGVELNVAAPELIDPALIFGSLLFCGADPFVLLGPPQLRPLSEDLSDQCGGQRAAYTDDCNDYRDDLAGHPHPLDSPEFP
ncbi:hypothetical protein ACWEQU_17215 [Streptomyces nodosus]